MDVIPLIVESRSLKDVSLKTGLALQTIERWLEDSYFVGELQAHLERKYQGALRMLKAKASDAVCVLAEEMEASKPNKDRILAADKILMHTLKYLESLEYRDKIVELQQQMRESNGELEVTDKEAGEPASLAEEA